MILALSLAACGSAPDGPPPLGEHLTEAQAADGRYIVWKEHLVDDQSRSGGIALRGGSALDAADLDDDGFIDVVSVFSDSTHLRLAYSSDEEDDWFRLSLGEGEEVSGLRDVALADVNGDGDVDAVAAGTNAPLLYLENPDRKGRGFRWARSAISEDSGFTSVAAEDLDGDQRAEIVAAREGEIRILFANEGEWNSRQFEAPYDAVAELVDLDGDRDLDVVAGWDDKGGLNWYENKGELSFEPRCFAAGDIPSKPSALAFGDFNRDGRMDVVAASEGALFMLEQPAKSDGEWPLSKIGSIAPDRIASLAVGDVNDDGAADVFAGSASQGPVDEDEEGFKPSDPAGRIAWFANPAGAGDWTRHDIVRRQRGAYNAFLVRDMDEDGDIDLLGMRGGSGKLDGFFWLEQQRAEGALKSFSSARKDDSAMQPAP